jgi:hypothetical protein
MITTTSITVTTFIKARKATQKATKDKTNNRDNKTTPTTEKEATTTPKPTTQNYNFISMNHIKNGN